MVETDVERVNYIDLASDDEELSIVVKTEIEADSFVDLISDDEDIVQCPTPAVQPSGESEFKFRFVPLNQSLFCNCFA